MRVILSDAGGMPAVLDNIDRISIETNKFGKCLALYKDGCREASAQFINSVIAQKDEDPRAKYRDAMEKVREAISKLEDSDCISLSEWRFELY